MPLFSGTETSTFSGVNMSGVTSIYEKMDYVDFEKLPVSVSYPKPNFKHMIYYSKYQ